MNTDFPEDLFIAKNKAVFDYTVNNGRKIAQNKSIILCGIVRNVSKSIERNIACLHRTGQLFKDYHIYLYENDSSDNTVELLTKLKNNKFTFFSEHREDMDYRKDLDNGVDTYHYKRSQILANCRNKYLNYVREHFSHFDYMCVVDLDIKGGWSYDGFLSGINCIESENKTACVSAYGVISEPTNSLRLEDIEQFQYIFYDSFAFRPKNISGGIHIFNTSRFNLIKFQRGEKPIEVRSNFNGLGIYKIPLLNGVSYGAKSWQQGYTDTDHVVLHDQLIQNGYKIMLDPSMIVSYSDHKYSRIN